MKVTRYPHMSKSSAGLRIHPFKKVHYAASNSSEECQSIGEVAKLRMEMQDTRDRSCPCPSGTLVPTRLTFSASFSIPTCNLVLLLGFCHEIGCLVITCTASLRNPKLNAPSHSICPIMQAGWRTRLLSVNTFGQNLGKPVNRIVFGG
ncbi:hypothetical protein GUJ93_ZPchr0121g55 [Zizania palustris]|uniref:Uncharacterized protein n=1 Tax=Zizania palustris TaxID=103762 RepID=A0A8J5RFH2_ZIZPA|nr:hypothetical protein GUJ93_ZPchr0121g55 [Zizania palustris]